MSSIATKNAIFSTSLPEDDPLALLPRTSIRDYAKNEIIYDHKDRNETLYLVLKGLVKVSRIADGGTVIIFDFCRPEDFFGETTFLGGDFRGEQTTAVGQSSLMSWSRAELKRLIQQNPALGLALLGVLARKLSAQQVRIESFHLHSIRERLMLALLHLALPVGHVVRDDAAPLHIPSVRHKDLADYVGATREAVTHAMNQFRRDRLLGYSRRGIDLDPAAALSRSVEGNRNLVGHAA